MQLELTAQSDQQTLPPLEIVCEQIQLEPISVTAIPIRLGAIEVKTSGFVFPEAPTWKPPGAVVANVPVKKKPNLENLKKRKTITRIRPPGDVIKLKDRLYYLLQPPLESLVGSAELTFPFEPFPYQFDGMAFLFPRYSAVLADEMGLGKTMQAISTMRLLLYSGQVRNILLVCPKPLVSNWMREFRLWAPEIPVTAIEGDANKRYWQWKHVATPVKIANYELMMRDKDLLTDESCHYDLVVLDEAQRIKNRSNSTSEIVRAIPRTRSWALTGTPIENSTEDLVGIFEFLSPGFLKSEMRIQAMGQATKDHILRRTKEMVLEEMPPKMYRDPNLDLSPEQYATYRSAEDEGVIKLEELEQELTIQHVFELVLRLKQICNFDPSTGASVKLDRLVADMEEVAASGQKAIVFSQWVDSLKKMQPSLDRFGTLEYHGRIPHKQREKVIDQFKNDPNKRVILMSYGAGSVGLNLQFCHYVFLFDRWWNPAIEDQAINRAHRIGVTGPVTVTRMTCNGTIEQRIAEVLDQKRSLLETIFAEAGTAQRPGLTRQEIFGLFNLRTPKGAIKAA